MRVLHWLFPVLGLLALVLTKASLAKFIVDDDAQKRFDNLFLAPQRGFHGADSIDVDAFVHSKVNMPLLMGLIKGSDSFYAMKTEHVKAAHLLKNVFLKEESIEDFLTLAEALRSHKDVNNKLWLQALLLARVTSSELRALKVSVSLPELLPDLMFSREDLEKARHQGLEDECIVYDETFGEANGIENNLWYFRQDVFANAHHINWHLHQSVIAPNNRHGELFYFMHHEFVGRYIIERITNGLPTLTSMPIEYGFPLSAYDPHLTDANSGRNYTPRVEGAPLVDMAGATLSDQIEARQKLIAAIEDDFMIHRNGTSIPILNFDGVDHLSKAIETSRSMNFRLYGLSFHGFMHQLIASVMDPQHESGEYGVMISPSTSMRDPMFYAFHKTVDDLFLLHKARMEPYTPTGSDFPLKLNTVTLLDLEVNQNLADGTPNVLETHWSRQEYNLSQGIDWLGNESMRMCSKHLNYDAFDYNILVESNADEFPATFRIFLAPRFNVNGERYSFEEQRLLFVTLDTFTTFLSLGVNDISRSSKDSRLTIPSNTWLNPGDMNSTENFCGCGWPRHLLLPKGTPEGFTFDLFVMVTDGTADIPLITEPDGECSTAPIWCGVLGQKYPDSRPLGYPFDRRPYTTDAGQVVQDLEEYVQGIPNMKAIQVKIVHKE